MFKFIVTVVGVVMALMIWDIYAGIYRAGQCGFRAHDAMAADMERDGEIDPLTISIYLSECIPRTVVTVAFEEFL
jgi:hypothetical protein